MYGGMREDIKKKKKNYSRLSGVIRTLLATPDIHDFSTLAWFLCNTLC